MSSAALEFESANSAEDMLQYRAVHIGAIIGLALGILSVFMVVTAANSFEGCLLVAPIPILGIVVSLWSLSQIRRDPEYYTGRPIALLGLLLSLGFLVGGVGFGGYVFATEVPEGYGRISFAGMKPDELEVRSGVIVPPEIAALDGKRVFIKGYIRPDSISVSRGIKNFLLVRDNNQCCFGDLSKINYFDQMYVDMTGSRTVDYSQGVFRMGGVLKIEPQNFGRASAAPVFLAKGGLRELSYLEGLADSCATSCGVPIGARGGACTARRPIVAIRGRQAVRFVMAKLLGSPRAAGHIVLWAVIVAPLLGTMPLMIAGCGSGRAEMPSDAPIVVAPAAESVADQSTATTPKKPLPPGAKTAALEKAGDRPYDKTFDDMRFDIQPGQPFHRQMLPPAIEALTGQRIRIRGYILPTAQKRGIKQFVLVRDNQECCFGPGAALYDCILVEMQAGATAEYSIRPVAVEGTFDIQEVMGLDGKHLAIYHLSAESVR